MGIKTLLLISIVGSSVACGGPAKHAQPTKADRPMGAHDHLVAARDHDRIAAGHAQVPAPRTPETRQPKQIYCLDQPLAGVPYSGGVPLRVLRPCWTSVVSPDEYHKTAAARHRKRAAAHRLRAKTLVNAERQYCANLGEAEISQSPFWHADDILSVRRHPTTGPLRGAAITFRRVRGLSAAWLQRAGECHRARSAMLGYPGTFMPYCPLVLGKSSFDVSRSTEGYVVTIQSNSHPIAAVIWGRARDLQASRPAPVPAPPTP